MAGYPLSDLAGPLSPKPCIPIKMPSWPITASHPRRTHLDRHLDRSPADDGVSPSAGCSSRSSREGTETTPRGNTALGQLLLRRDRDLDLGTGGEQRHPCLALRCDQLVCAMAAGVLGRNRTPKLRQVLAGQRHAVHPVVRLSASSGARRLRPRRPAGTPAYWEWRGARRDARPADASDRPRPTRSSSCVIT